MAKRGSTTSTPEPLLIGDRSLRGSGEPLVSTNPATGEVNTTVSTATKHEIEDAVDTAQEALTVSDWANQLPHKRADYLHRISCLLLERSDDLARTVMHENGKTLDECKTQAIAASGIFRYYAALCETLGSEVTPSRGDYLSLTTNEPIGVVAAITPWNSPINLAAEKLAPALAAGNAVILKPSEITSLVSLELGQLCLDAGLPPGLVNVLPGDRGASSMLVNHPGVNMVSFTGGTAAGLSIARSAAERLIPTVLELGGKSPNIVFDDADLTNAAAGVAAGIFGSMGQSCIAGSRLFVHERIHAKFLELIASNAESLRIGPPAEEGTDLGPLATFQHRDHVHSLVSEAREAGGKIVTGGARPSGDHLAKGAYYLPTIIDELSNDCSVCQTEVFGPVLCVLPFSDEEALIRTANDTVYGLACGIWTEDFRKAWRVARRMHAGTVWINTYRKNSVSTPFGGYKLSGLGRERGLQGLRQYQQVKSIFVSTDNAPLPMSR